MNLKEINKLAIPAIVAGIAEPLIALSDTAIIGHLGTAELAAVGVGSSLFLLQIWALSQTKSAISAITAIYYGKKETEKIASFVVQSFFFNLVLGGIIAGLSVWFLDVILSFYNATGIVFELAKKYYVIRSIGLPLTLATYGLFGVFRGFQNTFWAMQISIIGGVINVVFDLILVFGIPSFISPLGVEGAAWASLLAQIVMLFICLYFLWKKRLVSIYFTWRINEEFKTFFRMFINLFLRTIALNTAYFLGTKYATSYGQNYIAAHSIAMNIWLFSSFFIDGYATAGNAIAGKLLGAGDKKGIGRTGKKIYQLSIGAGGVLGFCYLVGYPFIGAFFSKDPAVVAVFDAVFWMVILSQPLNGLAFGLDGVFKGMGRTVLLRNVLFGATFLGFVPTLVISNFLGLKLHGVWLAFLVFMAIRSFSLLWKFNREYVSMLKK